MPDSRPAIPRTALAGVFLLVLGLGLWGVYQLASGSERHAFTHGGAAPSTVHVTSRHTYHLAVPGGVATEARTGLDPGTLRCTLTPVGGQSVTLSITAEQRDTKATEQIATFVAPVTGRAAVACPGMGAVFVDNADDASSDSSGLFLVLASIALAVGLPLVLSVLRRATRDPIRSGQREREDDDERFRRPPGEQVMLPGGLPAPPK